MLHLSTCHIVFPDPPTVNSPLFSSSFRFSWDPKCINNVDNNITKNNEDDQNIMQTLEERSSVSGSVDTEPQNSGSLVAESNYDIPSDNDMDMILGMMFIYFSCICIIIS